MELYTGCIQKEPRGSADLPRVFDVYPSLIASLRKHSHAYTDVPLASGLECFLLGLFDFVPSTVMDVWQIKQ